MNKFDPLLTIFVGALLLEIALIVITYYYGKYDGQLRGFDIFIALQERVNDIQGIQYSTINKLSYKHYLVTVYTDREDYHLNHKLYQLEVVFSLDYPDYKLKCEIAKPQKQLLFG